ncbi:hypothetical protein [Brucella sp. NBRC 12950]|uniref:hypothetical protein n=1 Tax=Brucella sp. NBRC 12950 TaxID=2994518 RepID=UPI0025521809|nr:hypothetical protein [Brucella sp. NBRC 12950]
MVHHKLMRWGRPFSGVNSRIVKEIKTSPVFKRSKWPGMLDFLIDNHYDDATIVSSDSVAKWAAVNYNTVWRMKNYLLEKEWLVLINRNGLMRFNPTLVLVKNRHDRIIIAIRKISY